MGGKWPGHSTLFAQSPGRSAADLDDEGQFVAVVQRCIQLALLVAVDERNQMALLVGGNTELRHDIRNAGAFGHLHDVAIPGADQLEISGVTEFDLHGLNRFRLLGFKRFAKGLVFSRDTPCFPCHNPGSFQFMQRTFTIAIGSDHGGFDLKQQLISWLSSLGHNVRDCGTFDKASTDYPIHAYAVARLVALRDCEVGIAIDGAGIGSAMAANKVKGVRAAALYNEALARNSREHNGANLLTLGAGQTNLHQAKAIIAAFLASDCTEDRHRRRVAMIAQIESGQFRPGPAPEPAAAPVGLKEVRVDLSAEDAQRVTQRVRQILAQSGLAPTGALSAGLAPDQVARFIDHTLLKPDAAIQDIEKLVSEAREYGFYSVCVNSCYARQTKNLLRGSDVKLCCVVGFPLGAVSAEVKALETRKAIREGADEIDMVINVGAMKSGQFDLVLEDIRAVVDACKERRRVCKVILETALLTDEEKVRACQLSMQAGADFVKTSTGFSSGGATAHDIALMSSIVAPRKLGVKASGGVRTYSDAMRMIEAGATRIGASSSTAIVDEARALAEGREYIPKTKAKGAY